MTSYGIFPYSVSQLGGLFQHYSHDKKWLAQDRSHLAYFGDYFAGVDAKTIVVEEAYTDRDYLEDYAAYYARCHFEYDRRCARLHFFNFELDKNFIGTCLERNEENIEKLRTGYIGFIVVKPLPSTIIGRTCLKTFGNWNYERRFHVAQSYKAHLLGIELSVMSVPFQEQDTDVAACATSALWSALHLTGKLFHHHIPTPAEITEAAAAHQRPFGRSLPAANGLSYGQMADAIRSQGLEPLLLNAQDQNFLRIAAYAYMRAKIPSILIGAIGPAGPAAQDYGNHAIAVTGYSVPVELPSPWGPSGCLFRSTAISRLYAHDDQVGPFARHVFENGEIKTSWPDRVTKKRGAILLKPHMLIVPLYHKIRVPIDLILTNIRAVDDWLEMARKGNLLPLTERLEWDIYLNENTDLKLDLFQDNDLGSNVRVDNLHKDLPRYIWRAGAYCNKIKQFELLFDATDLLQGEHFLTGFPYTAQTCRAIGVFTGNPAIQNYIQSAGPRSAAKTARWFSDSLDSF